ncbi:ribonuclease H-like domain-containing protein [Tanacetum coccineum]
MNQPPGFTDSGHSDFVCFFAKSLYGLKEAPSLGQNSFYFTTIREMIIILTASSTSLLQLLPDHFSTSLLPGLDLSYAVQQLCLYMHDPREPHLNAMKRVLRYLRGTTDLGLQLFRSTTSQLITYSDADWAGCPATRRSTFGYCVFLGDNLLTWSSKRQDTLSRFSAEAEYRGVANAVAETS